MLQPDGPNKHVASVIVSSLEGDGMDTEENETRTDLDTHANMIVAGKHAFVLADTGRKATVQAFSPDMEAIETAIVDCAILYECPYSGKSYILVARNALHVPTMSHNLVPPFILREAGIVVDDVPKIHQEEPDVTHHSLYFSGPGLRIPLALWGVFSYFPTRKPTERDLICDNNEVILLSPDGIWNPHTDVFARNEENMLDYEGNITEPSQRPRILLETVTEDAELVASMCVSAVEAQAIDSLLPREDEPVGPATPFDETLEMSQFCSSIGATVAHMDEALFPDLVDDEVNFMGEVDLDNFMAASTEMTSSRGVTAEDLAKVWRIDIPTAEKTIQATTQRCVRAKGDHLSRNYSTNDRMLRYRRINQHFFMDTFFATKKTKNSSRGNTCMQLFVTDKGFVYVVPMKSKGDVPAALKMFAKEIGAPDAIVCDASGEQTSHTVRKFLNQMGTALRVLERDTQWSNHAELYIGLVKEAVRKDMKESNCPLVFWDYCAERRVRVHNLTARNLFQLDGQTPHFTVTGCEGDISNLCQYKWYDWIYYREGSAKFPLPREVLGRSLGPAKGEGNEMAQWCLKANGKIVPRRLTRPLSKSELSSETEQRKRKIFDELIESRWGTSAFPPKDMPKDEDYEIYEDDDESPNVIPEFDDPVDSAGQAIDAHPAYDSLIHAELMLPQDGAYQQVTVTGRTVGPSGRPEGHYDVDPTRNSIMYDVRFPDGDVKEYSANVIAENLMNQIDEEGFSKTKLKAIVDHRADDDAITKDKMYIINKNGTKRLRQTTCGWQLLVLWEDGSRQWINLSVLKECNPVEVAEYAKARDIDSEPAFVWWVPYTLRKRDVIISAITARVRRTTHKYGVEVPRNLQHAYDIDKRNKNTVWSDALKKEMTNVGVAFEIRPHDKPVPPGWTKVTGHLVFDVRMTLERKVRWVLDGHRTPDITEYSTFAGVVSRESVRIALTYAALNEVDVNAADIRNAYIQAPSSQKDFIICGPEFGLEHVGKKALIRRALYGGKTAGRDFRNHLRACMNHLGFKPCRADPDVWMRPSMRPDGHAYWEYVLLYTDDCLVVSHRGVHVLRNEIGKYFEMKQESIGPPDIYLGGKLREVELENGAKAWAFGSSQYVNSAVSNVEAFLKTCDLSLPAKANTPITNNYRPELDVSPELDPDEASRYQSFIGILRWAVELGRIDICCEVSMLSSHLALPRQGHMEQVFHIFAYLKHHHNGELVFDPTTPSIDHSLFERKDWSTSAVGLDLTEEMPPNMPEARGFGFLMKAYVDADHATDSITRKSRTGFLVFLNSAPIYWLSKKQMSVTTSSFGSEFTAMKQCTEYVRGLRYKLRMMGIPCEDPAYIFGDNQSVLANTTVPESSLKKKSQSICYHFVREGCARDEWRTAYVNTHLNPSDLLTKPLPSGEKRRSFVRMVLHHLYPVD